MVGMQERRTNYVLNDDFLIREGQTHADKQCERISEANVLQ